MSPLAAAALAAPVALLAWRLRTLTLGGAAAATAVGTVILYRTGWIGAAALAAFFLGGSLVSRLAARHPVGDAKGDRRDAAQVLANGGAAAGLALLLPGWAALWAVAASLAAAAADTWATSLGATSPTDPVDLCSGRRVTAGTSGGVTVRGTVGAAAGALTVGGVAALGGIRLGLAAIVIGWAGMWLDSALGSLLQGRFRCPLCDVASERRRHRCGTPTLPTGGLPWLNNDGVNALATAAAGLAGWAAWHWLG